MYATVTTLDGALGYTASEGPVYVVGPAVLGDTTQVASFGDSVGSYTTYQAGKLPDRIAVHFGNRGQGPVTALRMATSVAGSIPNYYSTVHAAFAGNDAANAFPGPFTFTGPKNVEVVFAANWDGGNVLITGTAADKITVQTETINANAGNTVKGNKVFGTVTGATKGAVGANAATATIRTGNKTAAASGSNAQLVLAGTPQDDQQVVVWILRDGDVAGPATPSYAVSFDGGDTFGSETAVPVNGALTLGFGLTATLSGSACKAGDKFGQNVVGPSSNAGDFTAALAVLSGLNVDGGEVHFIGATTGSIEASIMAWRLAELAGGRDWIPYYETRDYTAGETDAAFRASILADYGANTDPEGCCVLIPGHWETVIPGGRGIQRRSFAWTALTHLWRLPFYVHPSCRDDGGGPISGLYTQATPTVPNTHDERLSPGLGGSVGRMMTIQSLPGPDNLGQWFIGDARGLRSPGTRAAGNSDWGILMNARLGNRTRRFLRGLSAKLLASRYGTKANGTLRDGDRKKLEARITTEVARYLGAAVQGVRCVVSSTEVIRTTKKLPYTVFLQSWSYALQVDAFLGLEPVQ